MGSYVCELIFRGGIKQSFGGIEVPAKEGKRHETYIDRETPYLKTSVITLYWLEAFADFI